MRPIMPPTISLPEMSPLFVQPRTVIATVFDASDTFTRPIMPPTRAAFSAVTSQLFTQFSIVALLQVRPTRPPT